MFDGPLEWQARYNSWYNLPPSQSGGDPANAGGRLAGTVGSGALYQWMGLEACLWVSAGLIAMASLAAMSLPKGEVGTA